MKQYLFILIFFFTVNNLTAGGWTMDKGWLWAKTAFFSLHTDQRFVSKRFACGGSPCENGEIDEYFFNGRLKSYAAFIELRYGFTDRFELEFILPYYILSFKDDVNPNREEQNDIGDIKFGLRYNFIEEPLVYTLHLQGKAPTGFFVNDAETVPIGDAQWDLWINNQLSKSLWPIRGYVNLDLGYKFRFRPDLSKTNFAPGDEFTFWFEAGYNITEKFLLKGSINGFIGKEGEAIFTKNNILTRNHSDRRIIYAEPGIYYNITPELALEGSVKFPLAGKNFPAGNVYGIGVAYDINIIN